MIEENNELLNEVEFLKRNIKITKINEYEVENQQLREHAMRMDQVLQRLKRQIQNGTYAQAQPSLLGIQQQAQLDKDTLTRHIEKYKERIGEQERTISELQVQLHRETAERKQVEAQLPTAQEMHSAQNSI